MAEEVLRVGVTGHRVFDDVDAVRTAVDGVLDRLVGATPGVVLEVRSSLAEGADRLVVEQAMLRPGTRLVAVLPLDADDYAADFGPPRGASVTEFRRLLEAADDVRIVAPEPDRDAAYEAAGRAVVDASDVVVALWDGAVSRGRGGTAEIIEYANARGVAVEVVPVERPGAAATGVPA